MNKAKASAKKGVQKVARSGARLAARVGAKKAASLTRASKAEPPASKKAPAPKPVRKSAEAPAPAKKARPALTKGPVEKAVKTTTKVGSVPASKPAVQKSVPPKAEPKAKVEVPVPPPAPPPVVRPKAILETTMGEIEIEFWPDKAPRHVENFFKIAEKRAYDGNLFHKIIGNSMILTGCPKGDGSGGPGWKVTAEFNDARFVKGVVGMARGAHRDSAGSQFFICVADAPHLNGSYTAFGKVVRGQESADKIAKVARDRRDKPIEDVKLTRVMPKAEGAPA